MVILNGWVRGKKLSKSVKWDKVDSVLF